VKVPKRIFTGEPPGSMLFENQARKAVTMERKNALWNSVESRTIDFLIVCSQMPEHSSARRD